MAITALCKKERDYVLKCDRDSDDPTVFKLRSLDRFESAEVQRKIENPKKENVSETIDKYLSQGLVGWTNLKDSEGNEVPFSTDNMRLLGFDYANELLKEITGAVSPEEEKKSEGQS